MKYRSFFLYLLIITCCSFSLSQPKPISMKTIINEHIAYGDSLYNALNFRAALKEYLTAANIDTLENSTFLDSKIISSYLGYVTKSDTIVLTAKSYVEIPDSLLKDIPWFPKDSDPKMISKVDPIYPPDKLASGEETTVILNVWIDSLGNVPIINISKGADRTFNEAAIEAVRQWKFKPATFQKKKIGCWAVLPVKFKISK